MVAARSPEDTPVVVPARRSTDTVKAVRCDSLLTGTICGRSRRASCSSSIGTQMMPLVWRIMKATASGVACSAAMIRSPSFSRSSSSMMMTMRPARSSARISPTGLNEVPAPAGAAFPGSGSTLDMAEESLGSAGQYTRAIVRGRPQRGAAAARGKSGRTSCSRDCSVTAVPDTRRARTTPVASITKVIGTASAGPKPLALAPAARAAG